MAKISVVMCTYNGARYVSQQLQSLERQRRLPDELVISDDASSDGTAKLIARYAESAKFEVRIQQNPQNLGYIANFGQALAQATGDLIFLSDQDDVWAADKIERFMAAFAAHPDALLVYGDSELVDESLSPLGNTLWQLLAFDRSEQAKLLGPEGFDLALRRGNLFCGCSMAIRKSFRDLLLPMPPGFPHDLWIGTIAAALGRIALVEQPTMQYRQHAQQTSGRKLPGPLNRLKRRYDSLKYWKSLAHYERWALEHRLVRDRLREITEFPLAPAVFQTLDDKLAYLSAQAEVRRRVLPRRVPILYREWASGRYARFGRGWKSLLIDLLL
jgi:glycosyltransferase involved in cell wall biosynthesis